MPAIHKAILIVNLRRENSRTLAEEIRAELEKRGTEAVIFAFDGQPGRIPDGAWDAAFSLGGDGTVLFTARALAASAVPIFPIHLGTLGFLAGVERQEWLSVYEKWQQGTARISKRCMHRFTVRRGSDSVFQGACLNDIVISSAGSARLTRLGVQTKNDDSDGGGVVHLGSYRCDGLIIATPTGSTAYSMAAGGPIVDPEMEALIISPICPFTLSNRPLVLPARQTLLVTVDREQRVGIILTVDGQDAFDLRPGDSITVDQSPHYALLITAGRSSYYSALKNKLSWGGSQ